MLHSRIKLAGTILILIFFGCTEKNDFTLPVRKDELTLPINMSFKISLSLDNPSYADFLDFTDCCTNNSGIKFKGKREAGLSFLFNTNPQTDFTLSPFELSHTTTICNFDIPQGIYTYIRMGHLFLGYT